MKNLFFISLLSFVFLACDKQDVGVKDDLKEVGQGQGQEPPASMTDFSTQTLVLQGTFKGSAVHSSTTGKAKVYKAADNKLTLLIEDLKVDNGPDLRVYLAEDTAITNFVQLSSSVKNGTATYNIPTSVNLEKQKVVSIWCKQFSVSFGASSMTTP